MKKKKLKFVFAIWEIKTLPDDFYEFHISSGKDDEDQDDGYVVSDRNASLQIQKITGEYSNYYRIKFTAPACGLQRYKNYWLSPNQVDGEDPKDFGII